MSFLKKKNTKNSRLLKGKAKIKQSKYANYVYEK